MFQPWMIPIVVYGATKVIDKVIDKVDEHY